MTGTLAYVVTHETPVAQIDPSTTYDACMIDGDTEQQFAVVPGARVNDMLLHAEHPERLKFVAHVYAADAHRFADDTL